MKNEFQSGNVAWDRDYFNEVIQNMPQKGQECLDMGSGMLFAFEEKLFKARNGRDTVDCVDRIHLEPENGQILKYINSYHQVSIEKEMRLDKKYDCIFCFEVVEHVDKTDVLIKNCYNNLKRGGLLFFGFPNLASIYGRVELLLGFQPHVLEISNEYGNLGGGDFRKNE